MNILIPHSWLLEHLETEATSEEIQKFVSLCGPSIERIYDREGEPVYDIEVTTNRADSMSVRGVAREAAVILNQFGKESRLKPLNLKSLAKITSNKKHVAEKMLPLPTIVDDAKFSKRTMCVVLSQVKRVPTPDWMAKRLRQVDMNIHDAVIDITNYITHDLGHPCHAFDYDRIMQFGGMIIVKTAKAGKKFVTLDGAEYTTVGGEVVFENDKGEIIDLPGIMGLANTSINPQTKNVLFWLENIEATRIRFASMTHAIRTVAAQLFEKNVDPELAQPVFEKGVELFETLTGAKIASSAYDEFPGKKTAEPITLPLTRIQDYLGVELPVNTMAKILEDLGCDVKLQTRKLVVTPPSFRPDLEIPADIIEEIARIYGYHNLPSVLMPTAIPLIKPQNTNFTIENRIKHFLADIGWQEVYTYSMVSEEIAKQSGYPLSEHLKIQNPLSDDRVYLRRSLIPSLEEVIANNTQRPELSVFEIANLYPPRAGQLPDESLYLTLVSTRSYRQVKGDLESLLDSFFVKDVRVVPIETSGKNLTENFANESARGIFQQMAEIMVNSIESKKAEKIGKIDILKNGHVAIWLSIPKLIHVVRTHPSYQPLPKTGEIIEDLTFTVPAKTLIGELISALMCVSPLVTSVSLKDVFGQNFTLRFVYHDPEHNIMVDEVQPVRKKIVEAAEQNWHAQLVGKIA